MRAYTFNSDDTVEAREISVPDEVRRALGEEFLLFFTGRDRSAADVLSGQVSGTASGESR